MPLIDQSFSALFSMSPDVEEFSVSNFVGVDSKGAYVTPKTPSILPSITNKMMMQVEIEVQSIPDDATRLTALLLFPQIAESKLGLTVEARPLAWGEVCKE